MRHMSMIENLNYIKENGMESFLEQQIEKWNKNRRIIMKYVATLIVVKDINKVKKFYKDVLDL